MFRKDSAGLGVPRGSLGKLNSFSGQAVQHGMAQTSVYYGGEHGAAEGSRGYAGSSFVGHVRVAERLHSSSISNMPSASAPSGSRGSAGGASSGGGHH